MLQKKENVVVGVGAELMEKAGSGSGRKERAESRINLAQTKE